MNYGLDEVFEKFAQSFGSRIIKNWSRIITLSYVNGSNLQKAIRENRDLFILKKRTKSEIRTITSRQRLNFLIIKFMPFVIIMILISSSMELSEALYEPAGRVIMTIALVMIYISELIAGKISRI